MEHVLRTAQIFSSNMVFQREKNVVIWGEGRNNSQVSISFHGHKITKSVIEYKWEIELPPMEAGGPYVMEISDGTDQIVYENIMIGEVWFAGGQSNMELELQNCLNGSKELEQADYNTIRFYNTAKIGTLEGEDLEEERKRKWQVVKPDTAYDMSAVAYFYARELSKNLGVTIGIIDCYWGGTSISSWVDKAFLEENTFTQEYLQEWNEKVGDKTDEEYEKEIVEHKIRLQTWSEKNNELKAMNPDITWEEIVEQIGDCPWENPAGYKSPYRPGGLYETMVQRVMPYTIKGFLWYQGESDESKGYIYDKMLYHLIELWRKDWRDETLPFHVVQLPMWIEKGQEDPKLWPVIREMQRKVTDTVKNTYLTVLLDCGEFDNIHPLDKQTVGYRLSLQSLKYTYKLHNLHSDSPKYLQRVIKDDKIVLYFDHVYGGFMVNDKKAIRHFEIAGEDKVFMPAEAYIDGDTIVVSNKLIKNPKYARYGWVNYGIVNLFSAEGFPVAPFVTK